MKRFQNTCKILVMVTILLGTTGCSNKVVSFVNEKAKFKTFETYRMVSPKVDRSEIADEDDILFQTIKSEISREMDRRSYVPSSVSPDLLLRYELTTSTRVQTDATQDPFSPVVRVNTRTIHEGVLLLELYDSRKKLVWQGSYDLEQERKEKKLRKIIHNAVGKIFTTYPYRALSNHEDAGLKEFKKD